MNGLTTKTFVRAFLFPPIALIALGLTSLAPTIAQTGGGGGGSDMKFDVTESEQQPGQTGTGTTTTDANPADVQPSSENDPLARLASGSTADATQPQDAEEPITELVEEIYSVSRIYALRLNRLELAPNLGLSANDQYVSHTSVGLALNYWFTNVLAVGVNFNWYSGLESESELSFNVRRSTRLAVPITSYQFGFALNFTYVPLYGKFMMFREFIFEWDAYIVGGVGALWTRPVPVVDPAIRRFDFEARIAFNLGIGLRVFITRWLAAFVEARNYMYLEKLENNEVALGDTARQNTATWLSPNDTFTNNITFHVGLNVFVPFDFEYRRPR